MTVRVKWATKEEIDICMEYIQSTHLPLKDKLGVWMSEYNWKIFI